MHNNPNWIQLYTRAPWFGELSNNGLFQQDRSQTTRPSTPDMTTSWLCTWTGAKGIVWALKEWWYREEDSTYHRRAQKWVKGNEGNGSESKSGWVCRESQATTLYEGAGSLTHKAGGEARYVSTMFQHPPLIQLQSPRCCNVCLTILAKSVEWVGHVVESMHQFCGRVCGNHGIAKTNRFCIREHSL